VRRFRQLLRLLAIQRVLVRNGLDEIVWRTQSTDTWVAFKVFGVTPLVFIFAALQYPLLTKHDAGNKDGAGR